MNTTIRVRTKPAYGTIHHYIRDEATAQAVSMLTKKKTVDAGDIKALQALGFTVIVE